MTEGRNVTVNRAGRVLDASGRPVAGAVVAVVSGTAPTPEIGIRSGADGRFTVALPAGKFRLQAHAGGQAGAVEVEGDGGEEIVIQIQPSR